MKATIQSIQRLAATAALIVSVSTAALAAGGPGWGMHPGMMDGPVGMPGAFGGPGRMMGSADPAATNQQLSELKTRLDITPAQEPAWDGYASAVTARAAIMNAHRQTMFNGRVSPAQMHQFRQAGFAQMRQLTEARRHLRAVLTPEQRARAGGLMNGRGGRW